MAFRVGAVARILAGDLGFNELGIGDGEGASRRRAAARSWLRCGEVRLELLSGGTLSAKAAGADTEDHVERA